MTNLSLEHTMRNTLREFTPDQIIDAVLEIESRKAAIPDVAKPSGEPIKVDAYALMPEGGTELRGMAQNPSVGFADYDNVRLAQENIVNPTDTVEVTEAVAEAAPAHLLVTPEGENPAPEQPEMVPISLADLQMHKFIVLLSHGQPLRIEAHEYVCVGGAAEFWVSLVSGERQLVIAYGPGQWINVTEEGMTKHNV